MNLSHRTVERHLENCRSKLNVRNKAQLVARAVTKGLVSLRIGEEALSAKLDSRLALRSPTTLDNQAGSSVGGPTVWGNLSDRLLCGGGVCVSNLLAPLVAKTDLTCGRITRTTR